MSSDFEPDGQLVQLLQAEHQNGTWVGRELLSIANRIRNRGGSESDYTTLVKLSNLWSSYTGSTSDSATAQRKHLGSAWDAAERSKPFELHDVLGDLLDRIAGRHWPGRAGARNQAVALAFVGFCRDHNCFTRTISRYELAKYTPGYTPKTVGKGLADLVQLGLLSLEHRSDRRSSSRSTNRYRVNLYWNGGSLGASQLRESNGIKVSMSTGKHSLTLLCQTADKVRLTDLAVHDIWSRQGLGQTALLVWSLLLEHPGSEAFGLDHPSAVYGDGADVHVGKSADELTAESGMARRTVDAALLRLFESCMVVQLPGRPRRWLRAAYPPADSLADVLGATGARDGQVERIEQRQRANRAAYPRSYQSQEGTTE